MGRIQSAFNVGATLGPLVGAWIYELFVLESLEILGYKFFGGGVPFLIAGIFGLIQVFTAVHILRGEKRNRATKVVKI